MFIPHIDISTLSFSSTTMHLFELYAKSKSPNTSNKKLITAHKIIYLLPIR